MDNEKNALLVFVKDGHYRLWMPNDTSSPVQTMVYPGVVNNRQSMWLIPTNGLPPAKAAGLYVWSTQFTMPADADPSGAVIKGRWAGDSTGVDILVNGTPTMQSAAGASAWSDFALNGPFRSGRNTLQFQVRNSTTGPDALRVEFLETTAPPTVAKSGVQPEVGMPPPPPAVLNVVPSSQTVVAGTPATLYIQYSASTNVADAWQYTVGVLWPPDHIYNQTAPGWLSDSYTYTAPGANTVEVGVSAQDTSPNPAPYEQSTVSASVNVVADPSQLPSVPTVGFSSATYSVAENAGNVTITVNLSAASQQQVVVGYATSAGTAVPGTNYQDTSGYLIFSPGVTQQSFYVSVTDEGINAPPLTVNLTLSNPANATLGNTSTAVLTIQNTDPQPTVQFAGAIYVVLENASSVTLPVILSEASGYTVTVTYNTADGTAKAGTNYTAQVNQQLSLSPGTTSQNITIPILNDGIVAPNTYFTVSLSAPSNAPLAPNGFSGSDG